MKIFSNQLQLIFSLSVLVLSLAFAHAQATTTDDGLQTYIIHVDDSHSPSLLTSDEHRVSWHKSFLPHHDRLLYSYHTAVAGFAARLTEEELTDVEKKPGFLLAYPDRVVPLHTTHSPQFLGLDRSHDCNLWRVSDFGEGVIVGVIDTGVKPDHPSFSDAYGAIPSPPENKWKGRCEFGPDLCNNKLIGARNFVKGLNALHPSMQMQGSSLPYDENGHGTHTAGTAVGVFVDGANMEGHANGTAAGVAPHAHLAVYKVCPQRSCATSDVVAGIDQAVVDGVDILSLSLGGGSLPYYEDGIAIAAFGAATKGIFVSSSAGNSGPSDRTLGNEAPWMLTVGATSVDRRIATTIKLGNGKQLSGESIYPLTDYSSPSLPLVYPGSTSAAAAVCKPGSLYGYNVTGKIVVCDSGGGVSAMLKGMAVKTVRGAGLILVNAQVQGLLITALEPNVIPESTVSYYDGLVIKSYITSAEMPTASITFRGTEIGPSVVAPVVASFSSRGPNVADQTILKPDIVGPGVNILAAWPFKVGTLGANYKMDSGTSMAAPHLSGVAALLKKRHPYWSPAAIKSAIMTTASKTTNSGKPIPDQNMNIASFFAIGAGHVDPIAATKPGLVYDVGERNYIDYLCGLGYTDKQIAAVARRAINCSEYTPVTGSEFNYPTFMVFAEEGESVTVTRAVTNVGSAPVTYAVSVSAPQGASVAVKPEKLHFQRVNEEQRFTVTFVGKAIAGIGGPVQYSQGSLIWASSEFKVNSPIMVGVSIKKSVQSM